MKCSKCSKYKAMGYGLCIRCFRAADDLDKVLGRMAVTRYKEKLIADEVKNSLISMLDHCRLWE